MIPNLNTVGFYISFNNSNKVARIQTISLLAEEKIVCVPLLLLFRSVCLFCCLLFCFVLYLTLLRTMYHIPSRKYQRSLLLCPLPQESKFTFSVLFLVAVTVSAVLLHNLTLSSQY